MECGGGAGGNMSTCPMSQSGSRSLSAHLVIRASSGRVAAQLACHSSAGGVEGSMLGVPGPLPAA